MFRICWVFEKFLVYSVILLNVVFRKGCYLDFIIVLSNIVFFLEVFEFWILFLFVNFLGDFGYFWIGKVSFFFFGLRFLYVVGGLC